MKLPLIYKIQAFWQPRVESAEAIAARLSDLVTALRAIDPLVENWFYVSPQGACYDLRLYRDSIIDMVVGGVSKGEFGEPCPEYGYHLIACNTPDVKMRPERLWLRGNVGGDAASDLHIMTSIDTEPSPDIITFEILSAALKAVMATFEPDWVSASPSDLTGLADELRGGPIQMPISWMIMMKPERAKLITPPSPDYSAPCRFCAASITIARFSSRLKKLAVREAFPGGEPGAFCRCLEAKGWGVSVRGYRPPLM